MFGETSRNSSRTPCGVSRARESVLMSATHTAPTTAQEGTMSNITASAKTAVTTENFVEAVLAEDVKFHTVRGNGTTRRIRVLKGDDLEVAEWVMEQREEGRTMKDIAAEMSVSVPTVRRLINRYLLTE